MTALHFLDPNPSGNPIVILIHGLGANGTSWGLQFPSLIEAGFRPIAIDAPGFGGSPYHGKKWKIKDAVKKIAGTMEEINATDAHFVGISMGSVIAQQFAHEFPERIRKLVLISSFAMLRPRSVKTWIYFIRRSFRVLFIGLPNQAILVANQIFPKPGQDSLRSSLIDTISSTDPRAYRGAMQALAGFDSRKWISEIKSPTLVLTGSEDTTIPPALQNELAAGIPGSRQVVIQGAGHALTVDHYEYFNFLLVRFLCEP